MTFDIRAAVRDAIEAGLSPDPEVLAEKVAADIPAKDLRAALASVLPTFISTRLSLSRASTLRPQPEVEPTPGQSKWVRHASVLNVPVVGADGLRKFLRDCTTEDLLAMVEDRRSRAAANEAMADKYEALRAMLAKRRARVVGDLPEPEVEAVFR